MDKTIWKNHPMVPDHIRETILAYINDRRPTGGFLEAVISNNLVESFARADEINQRAMFYIVSFFYNKAPMACWGSKARYEEWIKGEGKNG